MACSAGARAYRHLAIDPALRTRMKVGQSGLMVNGQRATFDGLFADDDIKYGDAICWYTEALGDPCEVRPKEKMYDVYCDASGSAVIDGTPHQVGRGEAFVSQTKKVGGYANTANDKAGNNARLVDVTCHFQTDGGLELRFLILVCNKASGIRAGEEVFWDYGPKYTMSVSYTHLTLPTTPYV